MTADPLEEKTGLTASQRRMRARIAANKRWANTIDRSAATRPAREALEQAFLDQVDPEGALLPGERNKRAENARTAFYQQMAYKSVQSRRLGRP